MLSGTDIRYRLLRSFRKRPHLAALTFHPRGVPAQDPKLSEAMQGLAHAPFHYLVLLAMDPAGGCFVVIASLGYVDADISQVRFRQAGPLVRHLRTHRVAVTYSQLATLPWFGFQVEDERRCVEKFTGACFVPLAAGGDLVGILVLGGAEAKGRGRQDLPSGAEIQPLVSSIEETQRGRLEARKPGPPGPRPRSLRPVASAGQR